MAKKVRKAERSSEKKLILTISERLFETDEKN